MTMLRYELQRRIVLQNNVKTLVHGLIDKGHGLGKLT